MQKRVSNVAKSAGQKKPCQKDACTCDEEMERVRDEIAEREARFQGLAPKYQRIRLDEEIRILASRRQTRQVCV